MQVPLGTPYLRAGAMHLGKYCETQNNEFMLCRQAHISVICQLTAAFFKLQYGVRLPVSFCCAGKAGLKVLSSDN